MKAVIANVSERLLAERRRFGADRWDEMWQGVLHMAPSPNREHQTIEFKLAMWLERNWAEPNGCRVYPQINVANPEAENWTNDYRIPDLVLLTPARFGIDRNEYFNGGPDAVVEIHSPEDETYEKLDFYFEIGVREVWIVNRDSKQPEVFEPTADGHQLRRADGEGWFQSTVANVEFRGSKSGKLEIRLLNKPESAALLP